MDILCAQALTDEPVSVFVFLTSGWSPTSSSSLLRFRPGQWASSDQAIILQWLYSVQNSTHWVPLIPAQ